MKLAREMYFAIMLDRATAGPIVIACSEGGTSIEDLAHAHPDKIIKADAGDEPVVHEGLPPCMHHRYTVPIDIRTGITDQQAAHIVEGLKAIPKQGLSSEALLM
eukprot:1159597-Pelagomonas_calceolata.AAC.4